MTDPNEGVTLSDTPTDPDPTEPIVAPAAAVSAVDDDVMVGDRPLRNIVAELDRKAAQRESVLKAEILAAISQRPAPPAATSREYSDEELAQLAAAGDARALELLTDRKAARHAAQQQSASTQIQTEQAEVASLYGRYPVLRDSNHALTAYAAQVKAALLAQGSPNTYGTVRDAILRAIADNPALIATASAPAPAPRSTAPTHAAAAPAPRRAAPAAPAKVVSDKEWEIAKRMGFKDRESVAKAKVNFERRQESGQSRLGAVGMHVREDA